MRYSLCHFRPNSLLRKLSLIRSLLVLLILVHLLAPAVVAETGPDDFVLIYQPREQTWTGLQFSLADSLQLRHFPNNSDASSWQNSTFAHLYVAGALNQNFTFYSNVYVFTDISDRNYQVHDYQPYNGIPWNIQPETVGGAQAGERTWDYFTSMVEWNAGPFVLFGGVDYIRFGPARRNALGWAGNEDTFRPLQDTSLMIRRRAPVPLAGFDMDLGRINYRQYNGWLFHDKNKNKYFHTHRLSARLPAGFQLGLYETVIYGSSVEADTVERTMSPVYVMPFVPYFFAEHFTGDRDNMTMGMDLSWTRGNWELYSELLLDDMKLPSGFWDESWWANKWGITAGVAWEKEIEQHQFSWFAELTRIEPWTYSHLRGASHQYSHYGQNLATSLGPNSQELYTSLLWKTPQKLSVELGFGKVRKGVDRGSDLNHIYREGIDAVGQCYLCDYKEYQQADLSVFWEPRYWFKAGTGVNAFRGDVNLMQIMFMTRLKI